MGLSESSDVQLLSDFEEAKSASRTIEIMEAEANQYDSIKKIIFFEVS